MTDSLSMEGVVFTSQNKKKEVELLSLKHLINEKSWISGLRDRIN